MNFLAFSIQMIIEMDTKSGLERESSERIIT